MELKVTLTAKEIFLFSVHHFYHSVPGLISLGCTVLALLAGASALAAQSADAQGAVLAIMILVVVTQPYILYRKAVKKAADPQTSKQIQYKFDFNGIRVQQGKEKASLRWNQIDKVGKLFSIYIIYLTKERAYLIPVRVLPGGKKGQFLDIIKKYIPAEKRKGI